MWRLRSRTSASRSAPCPAEKRGPPNTARDTSPPAAASTAALTWLQHQGDQLRDLVQAAENLRVVNSCGGSSVYSDWKRRPGELTSCSAWARTASRMSWSRADGRYDSLLSGSDAT